MLRKHQIEIQKIAKDIAAGNKIRNILVYVTPGGGKSALPMVLAKELCETLGYRICWVVPRDALRRQGENDFGKNKMKKLIGHSSQLLAVKNEIRPSRDCIGYVTTYQAIAAEPQLHCEEFQKRKYILFLDECHHVPVKGGGGEEAAFYEAIAPLVRFSILNVFASGTLHRHDGLRIAFLPYSSDGYTETVDAVNKVGWRYVRYRRGDALKEEAIVPLHFHVLDGKARWLDGVGEMHAVKSLTSVPARERGGMLRTISATQYAYELIDKCVAAWRDHKQHVYIRAKLLVIAPRIDIAKQYTKYLRMAHNLVAEYATSDDSVLAHTNIQRFKGDRQYSPEIDVLVTVGMAYEGLDVPQITHIACLTYYRSRSWIEQCICRANRVDTGKTHGYIYYPDDPDMASIMKQIEEEQAAIILSLSLQKPEVQDGANRTDEPLIAIISPLDSGTTDGRGYGLEDGTLVDAKEMAAIETVMEQFGIKGASVVQFKQATAALSNNLTSSQSVKVENSDSDSDEDVEDAVSPSVLRDKLRAKIVSKIKRVHNNVKEAIIDENTEIKGLFGERSAASISTLRLILRYLKEKYSR